MDKGKKESNVIQLHNKSYILLDKFVEDFKSGEIKDAIIVYLKDGEPEFATITSSPYSTIGWLLFQTMQALFLEEQGKTGN